jgi:hypothetical protein
MLLHLSLDLGLLHSFFVLCITLPPWLSCQENLVEMILSDSVRFSSPSSTITCCGNVRLVPISGLNSSSDPSPCLSLDLVSIQHQHLQILDQSCSDTNLI